MSENLLQDSKPCVGQGKLIKVGDTVVISEAKVGGLHWDTSGGIVKLADHGNGKDVVLTVSAKPGGPSAPLGKPLLSDSYIRLVSTRHPAPNGDLIAHINVPANINVRIGMFELPDPNVDNVFLVTKVSGSDGPEIRRGDVVKIRGVSRDPWLIAPANATNGTAVTLDPDFTKASSWVFGRFGDDGDGNDD